MPYRLIKRAYHGTKNSSKIISTEVSFISAGFVFDTNNIFWTPAKSEEPEQPWGLVQTTNGAINRSNNAVIANTEDNKLLEDEISFGTENGIIEMTQGLFFDLAVSTCVFNGKRYFASSVGIQFPSKYVYETEKRINAGEVDLTVGKVIAEHTGCNHADPHLYLTNGKISRLDLLKQTAYALACQIK